MQPFDIEHLAQQAAFATHYQVKSKAQQKFYSLCLNISQWQLEQLIKNYSQNVLFVTMEFIQKILTVSSDICGIFSVINETTEVWFNTNTNANLVRGDGIALQYHVENSVSRTIGQCIKFIYMKKQKQEWMIETILSRPNLRYRLYLWKLFIQTVSIVDNNITFLNYRTLVYNFQEHIIPLIMDTLLPFFKSVKEQIEINDLSIRQSLLSVEENNNQALRNPEINLFNPNELKFTKMVFQVLKQVICFNYNITYSEYESEVPIENCLVCFPDPVTKKVANKQFITSIFYVAEKLINDSFEQTNLNSVFLSTTLQCIQKIMLTKLFYTSSQVKEQFIRTVLSCISKLMDSKKLNQSIILSLLESNEKLLINIELHLIRSYQMQFQIWMVRVKRTILEVFSKSVINIDSQIVTKSIQLVAKIVQEAISPQLKSQLKIFKNFGSQMVMIVLEKLFTQNQSMIGVGKVKSFEDLKKNLSVFMKRIRHLCCLNLVQTFKKIEPMILKIFHSHNPNAISNVYLFFSQFCDGIVLQKNIMYQVQQLGAGPELGKLLYYCLQWISKYRNLGESVEIIQISMLIFIEKLLSQVLTYFTYEDNQIKISAEIYKYIIEGRHFMTAQQFLTFCYRQIARNLTNGDFHRSSYTFEVLTTLLLKFKWGIKREYFKQTNIAKDFLQLCKQLSQTSFDGQTLTLRKQLYKIITNISFDDTLDDYRTNIDGLIKSLQQNLYINKWRVMYDLTGICEAIDTSAIYRYFIIGLEKSKIPIPTIMNQLFNNIDSFGTVSQKMEVLKSILKLQLSMVQNNGQRLSSQKNTFYNYKIISQLMPYWVMLLQQSQFQSEQWDEVIIYIYTIFNTILKNGNTNFFMLERIVPTYPKYVKLLMFNMLAVLKWVQQYPQLFQQYRKALLNLSTNLMQVIFCNIDQEVVEYFNQILNNFMDINVRSINTLSQGNKNLQDQLDEQLQAIKNVFQYLKNAKKLEHKQVQIRNFPILNQGIEHKYNYILALFKLGISSGKRMIRTLDLICKTINNMNFLAGASICLISEKLGINEQNAYSLVRIWRQNEEGKGQFGLEMEEDGFLLEIKQWFRKCNNSTMAQPDY